MSGTLSVYHWPTRPIKVKTKKGKKIHFKNKKHKKEYIQGKYKVLMLRSSHKKIVIIKQHSQFPTIFVPVSQYRSHSVSLDNAVHCPIRFLSVGLWGLHSVQWGQGGLQCGGDAHRSNRANSTVGTVQLNSFFWVSLLLPWIFLVSTVYGLVLSPIRVCIRFGTPALNVV